MEVIRRTIAERLDQAIQTNNWITTEDRRNAVDAAMREIASMGRGTDPINAGVPVAATGLVSSNSSQESSSSSSSDTSSSSSESESTSSTNTTTNNLDFSDSDSPSTQENTEDENENSAQDFLSTDDNDEYRRNTVDYDFTLNNTSRRRKSVIASDDHLEGYQVFFKDFGKFYDYGQGQSAEIDSKIDSKSSLPFQTKLINTLDIPEPRSGHQAATDSTFMYIFGGYNSDKLPNGLFQLDEIQTETDRLSEQEQRDRLQNRFSAFSNRNSGKSDIYHHLYNEIWRLNLKTELWERLPGKIPLKSASAGLVCLSSPEQAEMNEKNVYFYIGGTGYPFKEATNSIIALEISKKELSENYSIKYTTIGKLPEKIYLAGTCIDRENQILYIYGGIEVVGGNGVNGGTSNFDSHFYKFNLKSKKVEKINFDKFCHLPETSLKPILHYFEKKIYMVGGLYREDHSDYLEDIFVYDCEKNYWSKKKLSGDGKASKIIDIWAPVEPPVNTDTEIYDADEQFSMRTDLDYDQEGRSAGKTQKGFTFNLGETAKDYQYPVNRTRFAMSEHKNQYIFITGGEPLGQINKKRFKNTWLKDIWRLDLKNLKWDYFGQMKNKISFHSQVITNQGKLVVFGGKIDEKPDIGRDNLSLNEVSEGYLERSNAAFKVQIGVPRLSSLAEAVLVDMERVFKKSLVVSKQERLGKMGVVDMTGA